MSLLTKYCVLLVLSVSYLAKCDDFQSTLGHLKPRVSAETQATAAYGVIQRLISNKASLFNVVVNSTLGPEGKDTFQVFKNTENGTVTIIGSSGVAACMGFYHYLKHFCFCHVSWDGDQLALPDTLPEVNITITTVDRFRYYQNVCTTSYSFVWWNWTRWQREIDWMALNGINFPLAFTGQEVIWKRVYERMNLTQEQINEHISGPAFLSWNRMGNMRGFGGPLPESWHEDSLDLQHRILDSMRNLGIIPILPAFAGHVPRAFKELFPNASMTMMPTWNNFKDQYCCPYLLDPTDPLFREVGNLFMTELIAEFGTDHAYNCDTFNEMRPRTGNVTYLAQVGSAIFQAMTDIDPKAIWVKQNWAFVHEHLFWTTERARAFLTSVPIGRMLVLDLQSDLSPQYYRLPSYFGQPFIWCMLHNFGGNDGMYGWATLVNEGLHAARTVAPSMVGIGLTPEGINQNYVMYDLVLDMAWRTQPVNLEDWFSAYAVRRYGQYNSHVDRAWSILRDTAYNYTGGTVYYHHVIEARPSLELGDNYWYNTSELHVAWSELSSALPVLQTVPTYYHDLVDLLRECIQIVVSELYTTIVKAYKTRQLDTFQEASSSLLGKLSYLDEQLATSSDFLLGAWLNSAKAKGTTEQEKQLYEYNARNQITLWGPNGEILDYARKQWSGVVSHYYLPRWQLFLERLNTSLYEGTGFNQSQFNKDVFSMVEEPFTFDRTPFPDTPRGGGIVVSDALYQLSIGDREEEEAFDEINFQVLVV